MRKAHKAANDCDFVAYSCPRGLQDFKSGRCFPEINNQNNLIIGQFGEDSTGRGPMYLVTRENPPFCGAQMQIVVDINRQTKKTRGVLAMSLIYGNQSTEFEMNCE